MPQGRKKTSAAAFAEYSSLALLLPASTFVGYALGGWLDHLFATHWIYLAGLILGSAAGFVALIRQILRDSDDGGK